MTVLLVDDRAVAEEIVQEAFLAAYRRWNDFEAGDNALAYVRTVAVNRARSVLRRRRTSRRRFGWRTEPTTPPADVEAVLVDDDRRVVRAVRQLPRRQFEVVVLRYWSQLSEAEIAATLGISAGTVKSAARRALTTLERILEELS